MLSPTSPLNETSLSSPVVPESAEVSADDADVESLSSAFPESPPQAARAGRRRTADRAAAGRRSRRSTGSGFLVGERADDTVAVDPERTLCADILAGVRSHL
jgi:hypothetical protein